MTEEKTHAYRAEAMNTVFTVRIRECDPQAAERAAGACFRRIEAIEDCLSRYRPGTDVARVNRLASGQSLLVSETTHQCLLLALEAADRTGGLFDPTLGSRTRNEGERGPLCGRLELLPDRPLVTCREAGREIDLGGIGKGFALRECLPLLEDYGVREALLSAGASTHFAVGTSSWPIHTGAEGRTLVELSAAAWSTSGEAVQGVHVVHPDPATPSAGPFKRIGLRHADPALADAFSTAACLMEEGELQAFVRTLEPGTRVQAWKRAGGPPLELAPPESGSCLPARADADR